MPVLDKVPHLLGSLDVRSQFRNDEGSGLIDFGFPFFTVHISIVGNDFPHCNVPMHDMSIGKLRIRHELLKSLTHSFLGDLLSLSVYDIQGSVTSNDSPILAVVLGDVGDL